MSLKMKHWEKKKKEEARRNTTWWKGKNSLNIVDFTALHSARVCKKALNQWKKKTYLLNPYNTQPRKEISVRFINFSNSHQILLDDVWREKEETDKLNICRKQDKWKEVEKKFIYLHCQIGTDGEIQGEIKTGNLAIHPLSFQRPSTAEKSNNPITATLNNNKTIL